MIPKIIWQTYESEYSDIPSKAKELVESWKLLNSEWEYKYISGKERLKFVKEYFSEEWYQIYISYPLNVMRSDLWRYMCLYTYGGLYCDLDTLCKAPIENWLNLNKKFVISEEPNDPGYAQFIFASEKNHVALSNLLNLIKERFYKDIEYKNTFERVENTTGYKIFTESINRTIHQTAQANVQVLKGPESENLHFNYITNLRAGNGTVFDASYVAWQKEIL